MALYEYGLADERPEEFSKLVASKELIGVWNGKVSYGAVAYDGSGLITFDLPDEVVKRLNHGTLKIELQLERIGTKPGQPDNGRLELTRIEVVPVPEPIAYDSDEVF